jgi:hypothetical protein
VSSLRVGQIPREPLTITVNGGDLGDYTDVTVHMKDPNDTIVALGGSVSVVGQVVSYDWGGVSPFTTPGDYTVQVRCTAPGVLDYTTADTIEVYRPEAAP